MSRPILFHTITDPASPGGVEAVFRQVLDRAAREGHRTVELRCTPAPNAESVPLFVRDDPRRRLHLPSLLRLARVLARHRPAVVNVHFVTAEALCFAILKPVFGYRLVLSFHGSDLRLPEPKSAALLPRLLAAADAVTVVSAEMVERLAALPGTAKSRASVVPNGVDSAFWTPPPADPPGETLIAAGRLEPVKGFDILIDAFARIAPARPAARLLIAGSGSERQALEDRARAAGLAGRVEFPGFLGPDALRDRYRGARLFVLPSRSEGFPVALLEAMACGLPCVAADVGGVGEIVRPDFGRIVPPEQAPALAAALVEMFDTGAAARAAARARAERFSNRTMLDAYMALLRPGGARAAAGGPAALAEGRAR